MKNFAVLFVCMGNICRSATAHGVFKRKLMDAGIAHQIKVDSAGTHNFHPGSPPDARSQVHAEKRGYDLSDLRARQLAGGDFPHYDLILVMDWDNLALVQDECPPEHLGKVRRLTEFCLTHDAAVLPDPHHGGANGFDQVLDLVEDACDGLLRYVRQKIEPAPPAPWPSR
jgi:protein-tyrosine phosphatase